MSKRKKQKKISKGETQAIKKNTLSTTVSGWNSMVNWFILLVIILPVIISKSAIDPAISVRYIFLGFFMLLFTLFFSLKNKLLTVSLTLLTKAVFFSGIGFALWSLFSLFSSINPGAGYYETARNFLNIILLFLVMVMTKNEESKILKLCKALVIVSIIQSFVGILQYYDLAFTELPGNYKPYGLMANRNLFGSAQALLLPFTLFVLYKTSGMWKWVCIIAISGIIVSLIISQTRSAWLATAVLLVVSFLLVMIFSKANRKKWFIGYAVGAASVAALVFIIIKTDKSNELSKSLQERAISISRSDNKSASESSENIKDRLKIWEKSVELIKDHPVTGVGMAIWKLVVPVYGSKGLSWEGGYYVPDRPHNVYLQVAGETGIPGAILYFGMWTLIAIIAFKTIFKPQSEDRRILLILMLAGLAAFASDNMFSFANERIEHTLYVTLMGGIIMGSYNNLPQKEVTKQQKLNRWWLIAFPIIIGINIFLGFKKHNFEVHMNLASAYEKIGNNQEVIAEVEAGKTEWVTVDPEGKPIEIHSIIAYKNLKDYNKALAEGKLARKYNPNSALILNNIGTIYTDMEEYDKAIENYTRALQLAPSFGPALKNLATNYYLVGNYADCIQILEKVNIEGDEILTSVMNDAKKRLPAQK